MPMDRVLYNYFRSSASFRVRIALNLKRLDYTYIPVHLTRGGGEQFKPEFLARNPQALVPVYSEGGGDGTLQVSQSLAIIEYLEETQPTPPLLPRGAAARAYVRQISLTIACDIHPLANLRVLNYLGGPMAQSGEVRKQWTQHWISLGLHAVEAEVARSKYAGKFCFGETPTMADCCLVPQMFNAARFGVDIGAYPRLGAITDACNELDAFKKAGVGAQVDSQ